MWFLSWGAVPGRHREIASELGGRAYSCFPPTEGRRLPAAIRYLLAALRTVSWLVVRRPGTIVVTNPPLFPAAISMAYGALTGVPIILDDHPGSFGRHGDRLGARLVWAHRRLAPRALLCMVTDDSWCHLIEQWGGRGLVVHESPTAWKPTPARPPAPVPRVLFVSTFSRDEPVAEVLQAAKLLTGVELVVTGDQQRWPAAERAKVAANVRFVGLLPFDRYQEEVARADIVVALTTEPTSAMRAAFEAVWAQRPLVVSDWPLLRQLFAYAVHVENTPEAIAAGIKGALADHEGLRAGVRVAWDAQLARWEAQLSALRMAIVTGQLEGPRRRPSFVGNGPGA